MFGYAFITGFETDDTVASKLPMAAPQAVDKFLCKYCQGESIT